MFAFTEAIYIKNDKGTVVVTLTTARRVEPRTAYEQAGE